MNRLTGLLVLAAFGASSICFASPAGAGESSLPRFAGEALPAPPRQKEPWTAPKSETPPELVAATALLFDLGLSDPRSCEYREIRIVIGDVWGDFRIINSRGWVLPEDKEGRQRFAVAWNGLVYPLVSFGDRADYRADVLAAIKLEEERQAATRKDPAQAPHRLASDRGVDREILTTDPASLLPLRACMLLRLGDGALAAKLWDAWQAGEEPQGQKGNGKDDVYQKLLEAWAWSRFERTLCAHMRGDDGLALAEARDLMRLDKAAAQASARANRAVPAAEAAPAEGDKPEPGPATFIDFLSPLPGLLVDQERRARERAAGHRSVMAIGLDKLDETYKTPAQRVAALIDGLQDCADIQQGQPGAVGFTMDPIVRALIAQGDAAVEPLIACFEEDQRLTRSVEFHRDFFTNREVLPVEDAAAAALGQILHADTFGPAITDADLAARHTDRRHALGQNIRAYWKKNKGVPLIERWYRTLKDDAALPTEWAEAADNLLQPDTEDALAGQRYFTGWFAANPKARGKPQGEPLRTGHDPKVSDLLRRRVRELTKGSFPSSKNIFDTETAATYERANAAVSAAVTLVEALAAWDGKESLDDLRHVQAFLFNGLAADEARDSSWVLGKLIRYDLLRTNLGDDQALTEYAAWLRTYRYGGKLGGHDQVMLFEPMWKHPHDARMLAAATAIFGNPASRWNYTGRRTRFGAWYGYPSELLQSPLLGIAPFREQVLSMLADKTPVATLIVGEGGKVEPAGAEDVAARTRMIFPADPRVPKAGTKVTYRKCDEAAQDLMGAVGLPAMELCWSNADRDAALASCIDRLTRYGDRFAYDPDAPLSQHASPEQAFVKFPTLNVPATTADVKAGRAVFTFDDDAKGNPIRVWPGFRTPLAAQWIALKTHPRDDPRGYIDQKTGQTVTRIERSYEQSGTVYQAEEVRIGNEWRRFYGFVGQYDLARVPAEEVEFPERHDNDWESLSNSLDCAFRRAGAAPPGASPLQKNIAPIRIGEPVRLTMSIRNRLGIAQDVPAQYYDPKADGGPALRPGVVVQAAYASHPPPGFDNPFYLPDEDGGADSPWQPLALKPAGRWPARPAGLSETRRLEPTESFEAFTFDLRDLFDLSRPGAYWVKVTFSTKNVGIADGTSTTVTCRIVPP